MCNNKVYQMAVGLKHDLFKQPNKRSNRALANVVHLRHLNHVVVCSKQGSKKEPCKVRVQRELVS